MPWIPTQKHLCLSLCFPGPLTASAQPSVSPHPDCGNLVIDPLPVFVTLTLVFLRQAGTWDPLLQCLHLGKRLLEQQNKGLKITVCICSWGKFWTTRYKETKKPLLKNQEQKQHVGSKNRALSMPPAHSTTKGAGQNT